MPHTYHRYLSRVSRQPWAILPEKGNVIAELIMERMSGHRPTAEEIAERLGHKTAARQAVSGTRVVVVPIHGTIAHRADAFELSSGGTSCEWVTTVMNRLAADETVRAIVLDVDSPGGSTEGLKVAGDAIFAARQVKPIVAVSNSMMASAAFWLGSQAHEIVVEPGGGAGSVGVFMLGLDYSKHLEKEGISVNLIKFGRNKVEGHSYAPMSDETRAQFQSEVDYLGVQFHEAIARGREVSVEQVAANYGDGRYYLAHEALAHGMVDKIATLDETIARLMKSTRVMRRAAQASDDIPVVEDILPASGAAHAEAVALEMALELEAL